MWQWRHILCPLCGITQRLYYYGVAVAVAPTVRCCSCPDLDALNKVLQNQEQMRLNIGKKLKTASLDSRFTGSKKEEYNLTCSLLKIFKPKDQSYC